MRKSAATCLILTFLGLPTVAAAVVTEPTRVENETYRFAFTVPAGTKVNFERGGVGLSASHVPEGAARADYGLLVYGSEAMLLGVAEAEAAEVPLEDPEDDGALVYAADVADAAAWAELFHAVMTARGRTKGGEAKVSAPGGEVRVPFFTWEQRSGSAVHHALMYVVKHGEAFVYVQVESSRPLTGAEIQWLTTKLELLGPA